MSNHSFGEARVRVVSWGLLLGLSLATSGWSEAVHAASSRGLGVGAVGFSSTSDDGRYTAFFCASTPLIATTIDAVCLHDRQSGVTQRLVSTATMDGFGLPAVSGDGRYVSFTSDAPDLFAGDTADSTDLFRYDRMTQTMIRASRNFGDADAFVELSSDGSRVVFTTDAPGLVIGDSDEVSDVYLYTWPNGPFERISVSSFGAGANGDSTLATISADGRYVAFISAATNLVQGDTNGVSDVFLRDRQTGQTTRVSVSGSGAQANGESIGGVAISNDGRYVAYSSSASNLVPGDTNGVADTFVLDRNTGEVSRVSVASAGSQGNGLSSFPRLSGDGRYVAFSSFSSNLVPGDVNGAFDVFVHDRNTGQTQLVSLAANGSQFGGDALFPSFARGGGYLAFGVLREGLLTDFLTDENATAEAGDLQTLLRGPLLPGLGQGLTLTGVPSQASFYGGVTANDGGSFASVFTTAQAIDVMGSIHVDPSDVGQTGSLFVVLASAGLFFYQDASGALRLWDLNLATLQPRTGPRALQGVEDITIVDNLPLTGLAGLSVAVIIAYRDGDGVTHFHPLPILLSVMAP